MAALHQMFRQPVGLEPDWTFTENTYRPPGDAREALLSPGLAVASTKINRRRSGSRIRATLENVV
jgi:hypothetical protein